MRGERGQRPSARTSQIRTRPSRPPEAARAPALQAGRLHSKPHITMLKENNVRTGFFEREQFEAIRKHLPEYLKGPATFSYLTGWRKNEVLGLQWAQVDVEAGRMFLNAGTTKNDQARVFPFTEELRSLLKVQRAKADALEEGHHLPVGVPEPAQQADRRLEEGPENRGDEGGRAWPDLPRLPPDRRSQP